mmetsp:Transcript_9386/g.14302  ORF Transcript_9386/g.14302 Transcript_9386/m.14302 type:complete len:232 (-) Transcript_9386:2573-3268(-)
MASRVSGRLVAGLGEGVLRIEKRGRLQHVIRFSNIPREGIRLTSLAIVLRIRLVRRSGPSGVGKLRVLRRLESLGGHSQLFMGVVRPSLQLLKLLVHLALLHDHATGNPREGLLLKYGLLVGQGYLVGYSNSGPLRRPPVHHVCLSRRHHSRVLRMESILLLLPSCLSTCFVAGAASLVSPFEMLEEGRPIFGILTISNLLPLLNLLNGREAVVAAHLLAAAGLHEGWRVL